MIGEEFLICGGIVVLADAHDGAALAGDALLKRVQRGRFFDAWRAPGGPEIQHDDLAAKIGEMEVASMLPS